MIELIFSLYKCIKEIDGKPNGDKLQKNDLLLKEIIGAYGVSKTNNCER